MATRIDDPYTGLPPSSDAHAPDPTSDNEAVLLGIMLRDGQAIDAIATEDLYEPRHQTIHAALLYNREHGHPTDPIAVSNRLRDTKELARIGGGYLSGLVLDAPAGSAGYYAQAVREAAHKRRVLAALRRGVQAVEQGQDPVAVESATWDALSSLTDPAERTSTASTGREDLSYLLTGQKPVIPPPVYLRRADGNALFYAGRVNGLFGDPESAKTWIALSAVLEGLQDDGRGAFIDVDHNGSDLLASHLLRLGADPKHVGDPDHFRYYAPDDAIELRAAIAELVAWKPAVAVLDSMGELLPMLGLSSNDNDEITAALRALSIPLADAGTCVITIDHLPKNSEARSSGYAIGGIAKRRAVDGAYLHATARRKPAPGALGKITLQISKDRPGKLREIATGDYAGTYVLDSRNPDASTGVVEIHSDSTADGQFRPTGYMEKVSRYVEANPGLSKKQLEQAKLGAAEHVRTAVDRLVEEGYLSILPGARNAQTLHVMATFREDEDDQN